jgi:hypothetical protein
MTIHTRPFKVYNSAGKFISAHATADSAHDKAAGIRGATVSEPTPAKSVPAPANPALLYDDLRGLMADQDVSDRLEHLRFKVGTHAARIHVYSRSGRLLSSHPNVDEAQAAARKVPGSIVSKLEGRPASILAMHARHDFPAIVTDQVTDYDADQVRYTSMDLVAVETVPGTKLKLRLAEAVNASTFETYHGSNEVRSNDGDLDHLRPTHKVRQKPDGTTVPVAGASFTRTVITRDQWIGDGHQTQGGEVLYVTVEQGGWYYAVESTKRTLSVRSKADKAIWRAVKGGQTFRNGSWIYEPQRVVLVGHAGSTDADDAANEAWRWFREIVDQDDTLGSRVGRTFVSDSAVATGPAVGRQATEADWNRFSDGLTMEALEAIMRTRLDDARTAAGNVKRDAERQSA